MSKIRIEECEVIEKNMLEIELYEALYRIVIKELKDKYESEIVS